MISGKHHADGQARGVGACIDLGREAAARTAERVTLRFPVYARRRNDAHARRRRWRPFLRPR
jgi:hypothetical protein